MFTIKVEKYGTGIGYNYVAFYLPPEITDGSGLEEGDIVEIKKEGSKVAIVLRDDIRGFKRDSYNKYRRITKNKSSGNLLFRLRNDLFEMERVRFTVVGVSHVKAIIEGDSLVLDLTPILKKIIPKPGFSAVPRNFTEATQPVEVKKRGFKHLR